MLCYDREMWRRAQARISKMAFKVGIKEIPKLSLFLYMDHINTKGEYNNQEMDRAVVQYNPLSIFGHFYLDVSSCARRLKSRITNAIYEYATTMLFVGFYMQ